MNEFRGEEWVWKGLFSITVPAGWLVREENDVVEVVPPQPVGAAHISILNRTRGTIVKPGEASKVLAAFAKRQGIVVPPDVEATESGQRVARVSFQEPDAKQHWDVEARVWEDHAVVCSYVHDGFHEIERRLAQRIFSSVVPA